MRGFFSFGFARGQNDKREVWPLAGGRGYVLCGGGRSRVVRRYNSLGWL